MVLFLLGREEIRAVVVVVVRALALRAFLPAALLGALEETLAAQAATAVISLLAGTLVVLHLVLLQEAVAAAVLAEEIRLSVLVAAVAVAAQRPVQLLLVTLETPATLEIPALQVREIRSLL